MTDISIGRLGAPSGFSPGGEIQFCSMWIVPQDCTLNSISMTSKETNGSAKWRGVVYSNKIAGGNPVPDALLGKTTDITGVTNGATDTENLITPVSLSKGDVIWIGIDTSSTNFQVGAEGSNGIQRFWSNTFASGPAASAPSSTGFATRWAVWGTATVDDADTSAIGNLDNLSDQGTGTGGGNTKLVSKVNFPAATSSIAEFYYLADIASITAKVKAVLYADSAGSPGAKIAEGDEVTPIAPGWNRLPIVATGLGAGDYWIGIFTDTNYTNNYAVGSGSLNFNSDTYSDGATDPFGSVSGVSRTYNLFAVVDAGPAAPVALTTQLAQEILYSDDTVAAKTTAMAQEVMYSENAHAITTTACLEVLWWKPRPKHLTLVSTYASFDKPTT